MNQLDKAIHKSGFALTERERHIAEWFFAERNAKLLVLVNKAEDLICEMVDIDTPSRTQDETEEFFLCLEEYRRDISD